MKYLQEFLIRSQQIGPIIPIHIISFNYCCYVYLKHFVQIFFCVLISTVETLDYIHNYQNTSINSTRRLQNLFSFPHYRLLNILLLCKTFWCQLHNECFTLDASIKIQLFQCCNNFLLFHLLKCMFHFYFLCYRSKSK